MKQKLNYWKDTYFRDNLLLKHILDNYYVDKQLISLIIPLHLKIINFLSKIWLIKFEYSSFWNDLVVEISEGSHFFDLYIFKSSETKFHDFLLKIRGDIL